MSTLLFAEWRTRDDNATIRPAMAADDLDQVALRLRLTREALGLSQAELCRQAGINPAAWNNAETGDNRIGVDSVVKLWRRWGVTTNWIYLGLLDREPGYLAQKIDELMRRPVKQPRRRP